MLGASCGSREPANIEPVYDKLTGKLRLLKYDSNGDGKVDTWSYMDGTRVVRIEIDMDEDGKIDRWEYYDADQKLEKTGTSQFPLRCLSSYTVAEVKTPGTRLGRRPSSLPSELELQCQLDQARRLCLENGVKGWRTLVTVGQPEVGVVQNIKELRTELKLFSFAHSNVLECRKVPIGVTGALRDVAACGPELLHR